MGATALDSARAGLARILANVPNASIEPYAPLGPCPLVDRATVNGELPTPASTLRSANGPAGVHRRPAHRRPPRLRGHLHRRGRGPFVPGAALRRRRHRPRRRPTADGVLHDELGATGEPLRITDLDGGTIGECGDEDRASAAPSGGSTTASSSGSRSSIACTSTGRRHRRCSAVWSRRSCRRWRGRDRHRRPAADHRRRRRRAGARRPRRLRRRQPGGREQRARADRLSAPRQREPAAGTRRRRHRLAPRRLGGVDQSRHLPPRPRPRPRRVSCTNRSGSVTVDAIAFGDDGQAADFVASVGGAEGGSASDLAPATSRSGAARARAAPSTATSGGATTALCSA